MNLRIWIPIATLGAALAQDPNLPPQGRAMPAQAPDFSALRAYLNLSDGQLEKMRQAREAAARQADEKVKALMPQIEDKRMALQDLVDRGADPAAVGKALLELRALEKQAHQAREAARSSQLSRCRPALRKPWRQAAECPGRATLERLQQMGTGTQYPIVVDGIPAAEPQDIAWFAGEPRSRGCLSAWKAVLWWFGWGCNERRGRPRGTIGCGLKKGHCVPVPVTGYPVTGTRPGSTRTRPTTPHIP
jgi:hypothetical protein